MKYTIIYYVLMVSVALFSNLTYAGVDGDEVIIEKEQLFMPDGLSQSSPYKDKLPNVTFSEGGTGQPVVGCAPLALGRAMFFDMGINPNSNLSEFQHFLKNTHNVSSNSNLLSFSKETGTGIKDGDVAISILNKMGYVAIYPKKVNMDLGKRERISDIYIYVRNIIKEKKPVIVTSYKGGHAFIIDGYATTNPYFGKEDLYFHVLYGWGSTDGKWVQIDQGAGLEIFEKPSSLVEGYFGDWKIEDAEFFSIKQKNTYKWNGNGSVVSYSSGDKKGYGLNYDISKIHPTSPNNTVYFQWEIDKKDGKHLRISTPNKSNSFATITYGGWSSRSNDLTYKNIKLPFILDPNKDGNSTNDGSWYVVQVAFDEKVNSEVTVKAQATNIKASDEKSIKYISKSKLSPNVTWNGNASIISYSTDNLTGFGINYDISKVHSTSENNPTVFFQWQIDKRDGKRLKISAPSDVSVATITYGSWGSRKNDIVLSNVTLPYIIDPSQDGFGTQDGAWYVVKVDFNNKPYSSVKVRADAVK